MDGLTCCTVFIFCGWFTCGFCRKGDAIGGLPPTNNGKFEAVLSSCLLGIPVLGDLLLLFFADCGGRNAGDAGGATGAASC